MNKKKIAFGIGMVLTVVLAVFIVPAMAREDDVVFYFEPNEISVAPGDEVTVYLNANAPVNKSGGFEVAVMFNPDVVECLGVTENTSVTDWMIWTFRGVWPGTDSSKEYINYDAMDYAGQEPGDLRIGDMRLRSVTPGVATMYLGVWPDDVPDKSNKTSIATELGDYKNWTLAEPLTFTCTGPQETFSKPLIEGWNLISLPLTNMTDMTAANVIDTSLSGSYDTLYKYDASTHSFVSLSSSDTMDNGVGYFINMTAADTWSYSGSAYTSMNVGLSQGLNCAGWTNTSANLPGALSSIAGKYNYVARWNATSQSYEVYEPHAPAVFNDFDTMDRGEGYWIAAKESCVLS